MTLHDIMLGHLERYLKMDSFTDFRHSASGAPFNEKRNPPVFASWHLRSPHCDSITSTDPVSRTQSQIELRQALRESNAHSSAAKSQDFLEKCRITWLSVS